MESSRWPCIFANLKTTTQVGRFLSDNNLLGLTFVTQAMAADKMTVLLDWFVNPDHGPLIVAEKKGYFADAGLEVTMIEPANPNDPPRLVAVGQAELAV